MVNTNKEGIYGPYKGKLPGYWRVVFIDGRGKRSSVLFKDEGAKERAQQAADKAREKLTGKTVNSAINEYVESMGIRELSATGIDSTRHRLRTFFQVGGGTGGLLSDVTPARVAKLLKDSEVRVRTVAIRKGRTVIGAKQVKKTRSVAYRSNMLAEAGTFARWCVEKKYLRRDPTEEIKLEGKRRKGKFQLQIDEALQWHAVALKQADAGDRQALAAILCFVLGCRASEVTQRVARDFDRGCTVLSIPYAKSKSGVRCLEIPDYLVPRVCEVRQGLKPFERVFEELDRHGLLRVVKELCREADVPVVCTQSLRGLHATMAKKLGVTGHVIAKALGHADDGATAERSYIRPGTPDTASQQRVLSVLAGGRA